MEKEFTDSLFRAIVNDDLTAFDGCMQSAYCGTVRFGRFPVLSLLYLYRAKKILKKYEDKLIATSSYPEVAEEPAEVFSVFQKQAGKCLRLYFDTLVSPLEMMMLTDETARLKRLCPSARPSAEIKERLIGVYSLRYGLNATFEGDSIILERRPLTSKEKRKIAIIASSCTLALALAVVLPVTLVTTVNRVYRMGGGVKRLSQIDFASDNEYVLNRDLTLPEGFRQEEIKCTIDGNGHTLHFNGKESAFDTVTGEIKNLTVRTNATVPLIARLEVDGTIENIQLQVTSEGSCSEDVAYLVGQNYGHIKGVSAQIAGSLNVAYSEEVFESGEKTGIVLAGIVLNNLQKIVADEYRYGIIEESSVLLDGLRLTGEVSANASFSGIAGTNNAGIMTCKTSGSVVSDNVDVAGICFTNSYLIQGCENTANISCSSADEDWNPIACGITGNNYGGVLKSINRGSVTSVSLCGAFEISTGYEPSAVAAGICYQNINSAEVSNCLNEGNIEAQALHRYVYAAGLVFASNAFIGNCTNAGKVTATGGSLPVSSTAVNLNYGTLKLTLNTGEIVANGSGEVYAAGICARTDYTVTGCVFSGTLSAEGETCYAGGILSLSFVQTNYYVFYGVAEKSVSSGTISVKASKEAFVGGIAGIVEELSVKLNNYGETYMGGGVTSCYFTGNLTTDASSAYVGGVVGVAGKNIYDNNVDPTNPENYNFDGNGYVRSEGVALGIGTTYTTENDVRSYVSCETEKGCAEQTKADLEATENYVQIISSVGVQKED